MTPHPELQRTDTDAWPLGRLGSATLETSGTLTAGNHATFIVRHTVGPYGIDDAGGLKLVWVVQADIGIPQFDDAAAANHTIVRTNGAATLVPQWTRASVRPWSKGIRIDVVDGALAPGDIVEITVGDRSGASPGARVQSFVESDAALRLLVDPFATGIYHPVDGDLSFAVEPGPTARLVAIARAAHNGAPATVSVRAVDRHGNVAVGYRGTTEVRHDGSPIAELSFDEVARGVQTIALPDLPDDRPLRLEVHDEHGHVTGTNPLPSAGWPIVQWGDTQGQTGETVGSGTVPEFLHYARDVARLDFVAHSANDFQIDTDAYASSLAACDADSVDDEFIAFGGFEWSGTTPVGGDHNVLFASTDHAPLARSSHALVADHNDLDTDAPTAHDLYRVLDGDGIDAVCVPHVGGRRVDLSLIDPRHAPVLEIVSVHGWFEWLILDALRRGLIVGVIGASDDHSGRPGAAFPTSPAFGTRNGLAAVVTADLTRTGILTALRQRHCYATTGERILVDVRAGEHRMGDHWQSRTAPRITVEASGTAGIEAIEILAADGVLARWEPEHTPSSTRLRIGWRGARGRDRRRTQDWSGSLTLAGGTIIDAQAWAFDHPDQGLTQVTGDTISWTSTTNGDSDGVELTVSGQPDSVRFQAGGIDLDISLTSHGHRQEILLSEGVDRALTVTWLPEVDHAPDAHAVFDALPAHPGRNAYLVKVHQSDGELAWASPLYIDIPTQKEQTP